VWYILILIIFKCTCTCLFFRNTSGGGGGGRTGGGGGGGGGGGCFLNRRLGCAYPSCSEDPEEGTPHEQVDFCNKSREQALPSYNKWISID